MREKYISQEQMASAEEEFLSHVSSVGEIIGEKLYLHAGQLKCSREGDKWITHDHHYSDVIRKGAHVAREVDSGFQISTNRVVEGKRVIDAIWMGEENGQLVIKSVTRKIQVTLDERGKFQGPYGLVGEARFETLNTFSQYLRDFCVLRLT